MQNIRETHNKCYNAFLYLNRLAITANYHILAMIYFLTNRILTVKNDQPTEFSINNKYAHYNIIIRHYY